MLLSRVGDCFQQTNAIMFVEFHFKTALRRICQTLRHIIRFSARYVLKLDSFSIFIYILLFFRLQPSVPAPVHSSFFFSLSSLHKSSDTTIPTKSIRINFILPSINIRLDTVERCGTNALHTAFNSIPIYSKPFNKFYAVFVRVPITDYNNIIE